MKLELLKHFYYQLIHPLLPHGKIDNTDTIYNRFPRSLLNQKSADILQMNQWGISAHSSGLYMSFETNSSSLIFSFSYNHIGEIVGENIIDEKDRIRAASFFDLYTLDDGKFIYQNSFGIDNSDFNYIRGEYSFEFSVRFKKRTKYLLVFPSFSSVKSMCVFTLKNSISQSIDCFKEGNILIYGTSIVQGVCSSFPSYSHTWIFAMELKKRVLNMGVAGSAYVSNAMIDFLISIPSEMFFIDVGYNFYLGIEIQGKVLSKVDIKNQLIKLIKAYRKSHKKTPIILVEPYNISDHVDPQIYHQIFLILKEEVDNIFYMNISSANIPLVDHVHPNDEGMSLLAKDYVQMYNKIETSDS